MFFNTDYTIPQVSMFDQLGDVTAVICLDRLSLSTKDPHVGRALFFSGSEPTALDLKRIPGLPGEIEFSVGSSIDEYMACAGSLFHATAPNLTLVFSLSSRALKPLGLNCMLMSDGMGTGKEYDAALQGLGRAIGFKNSIVESFTPVREIEISKSKDGSRHMTSLVVREPRGGLQFFSRGDLHLVLSHCQEYWDGTGIKPLTDEIRKSIVDTYHIWSAGQGYVCCGMAYKAVKPTYNYLFENGRKRSQSTGSGGVRSRSGSVASAGRKRRVSRGAADENGLVAAPAVEDAADEEALSGTHKKQRRKSPQKKAEESESRTTDAETPEGEKDSEDSDDDDDDDDDDSVPGDGRSADPPARDEQSAFSTEVDSSWIEEDRISAMGGRTPSRSVTATPRPRNDETDQESDVTEITDKRKRNQRASASESSDSERRQKPSAHLMKESKETDSPSGSSDTESSRERRPARKSSPKLHSPREDAPSGSSDSESATNEARAQKQDSISAESSSIKREKEQAAKEQEQARPRRKPKTAEDELEESTDEEADAAEAEEDGDAEEDPAISSSAPENEAIEDRDRRRLTKIRSHQIFIGMSAITHDPKKTMPGFVDTLNRSFMRFVCAIMPSLFVFLLIHHRVF